LSGAGSVSANGGGCVMVPHEGSLYAGGGIVGVPTSMKIIMLSPDTLLVAIGL